MPFRKFLHEHKISKYEAEILELTGHKWPVVVLEHEKLPAKKTREVTQPEFLRETAGAFVTHPKLIGGVLENKLAKVTSLHWLAGEVKVGKLELTSQGRKVFDKWVKVHGVSGAQDAVFRQNALFNFLKK